MAKRINAYKKKRQRIEHLYFGDTETGKLVDEAPESRIPEKQNVHPIVYLSGLTKVVDIPECWRLIRDVKHRFTPSDCDGNPYWVGEGKEAALDTIKFIRDNALPHCDDLRLCVHNLTYDLSFTQELFRSVFGADKFHCTLKKEQGDVVSAKFKLANGKTILFHDLYMFPRLALADIYTSFGLAKLTIDYDKFLLMREDNSIVGYGTFELVKIFFDENGLPADRYIRHGVPGSSVRDRELAYLERDVKPLPLVYMSTQRFKYVCLSSLKKAHPNVQIPPPDIRGLYRTINTMGNLAVWMFNVHMHFTHKAHPLVMDTFGGTPQLEKGRIPHYFAKLFQPEYDPLDEGEYDNQELSFGGGFTSGTEEMVFQANEKARIVVSVDVNSMYPAVQSGMIPCGRRSFKPYPEYEVSPGMWVRNSKIHICEFNLDEEGNPKWIPWKKEHSMLMKNILTSKPYERYQRTRGAMLHIHDELYQIMCQMCDEVPEIKQTYYKQAYPFFKEFMDMVIEEKKKGDRYVDYPKDSAEYFILQTLRTTFKTIANSTFGKLCEKPKFLTQEGLQSEEKYIPAKEHPKYSEKRPYTKDRKYDLSSGFYVPAIAKAILLGMTQKLHKHEYGCKYEDTDAIAIIIPVGKLFPDFIEVDPQKLGAWKIEGVYTAHIGPGKDKKYYASFDRNIPNPREYIKKYAGDKVNDAISDSDLYKPKIATSGVAKDLIATVAELRPDLLRRIFDPKENGLIKEGTMRAIKHPDGEVLYRADVCFNEWDDEGEKHDGTYYTRGNKEVTGIIYVKKTINEAGKLEKKLFVVHKYEKV